MGLRRPNKPTNKLAIVAVCGEAGTVATKAEQSRAKRFNVSKADKAATKAKQGAALWGGDLVAVGGRGHALI